MTRQALQQEKRRSGEYFSEFCSTVAGNAIQGPGYLGGILEASIIEPSTTPSHTPQPQIRTK